MAASVLSTARAIDMSIFVVRAFLQLRDLTTPHRELATKLDELEQRVTGHDDLAGAARRRYIRARSSVSIADRNSSVER